MIANDVYLHPGVLLAEDDQIVRRRLARARDKQAIGPEEGAGLGDVLRTGVFPLPSGVAKPAVGRGVESDGGEGFEAGEAHDRFQRNRQFEQLVADFGRRERLALIKMKLAFCERSLAGL